MAGVIVIGPDDDNIGFTTGDELAVGVFHDIENDVLYFSDASSIFEWEGDSGNQQTYTWRSGQIRLPRPMNMGAAIVEADSYADVEFRLYANISGTMTLQSTVSPSDSEPFRLPGGYMSNLYEVQVSGTDVVTRISVAENIWDLAEG